MTIQAPPRSGWAAIVALSAACLSNALAQPATSLTVVMTNGPHAGTYELSAADSYCTVGSGDPDSWETNFGNNAPAPGALSVFVLSVPHTGGGSTEDFSLFMNTQTAEGTPVQATITCTLP